MINKIKISIITFFVFATNTFVYSQPLPPTSRNNPTGAPIDFGIYWLAIIGIALGLIYIHKRKEQRI